MVLPLNLIWAQFLLVSDILKTMDQTVNPCNDFYQFACGNYDKKIQLPDDEASIDSFVEVAKKINKELRILLEEPITQNDTKSAKMVKTHYKSCMNVTQLEKLGLEPWKNAIKEAGGWPMVEGNQWINNTNYNWIQKFSELFRIYGTMAIISIDVSTDSKNSSRRILQIDQPVLGLGKREYYLEKIHSDVFEAYRQYLVGTAVQLGASNETAIADVNALLEFETQLANISVRDEDRTNFTELYDLITVGNLIKRYPRLNLQIFFDDMRRHGWNLTDDTEINIVGGPYLEKLPDILDKTDKRVFGNYQLWDVVNVFAPYIAPSLRDNHRKFRAALLGVFKDKPRWEQCVDAVQGDLSLSVASMYVKRYFNAEAKQEMDRMVADIRQAMHENLKNSDWMDDKTKTYALEKLSLLIEKIGYPPYIFNETRLLRDKEWLTLNDDQYLQNAAKLTSIGFNGTMRIYRSPVNRSDWEMSSADVNAMYSTDHNTITFPAAILQYPFFSPFAPIYVNYGRIGSVIGHEITHGYDDEGRQFAGDGNLFSWWTDETLENFLNGSDCFTQEYSSIKDKTTGLNLNGELGLGENIADNGGMKLAFKAYRTRISDSKTTLHGIGNYTADQLFFISYGQIYCEIIRPETLKETIVSDVHSPNRYRVNVPLRNFPAFSDAFNCPAGSNMNPTKKCSIW